MLNSNGYTYLTIQKNTPKGALCKYSHSFEERLLNCDALQAFLRPGLIHFYLNKFHHSFKINVFLCFLKMNLHLI